MNKYNLDLLTPNNSVLLLVDYQPAMFKGVGSGDRTLIKNCAVAAVKATRHNKLIVSGLWTSMCFAFTTLHGLREGMDVYGLMDAVGDSTHDAHKYGIKRMLQAGVTPITWETITSEWMHDWTNPKVPELMKEVYGKYDIMLGM